MLYATNRFPGDGTTTQYEISFVGGYLDRSHVKAYVESPDLVRTPITINTADFLGPNTIKGFPAVPVGSTLVIYRDTPKNPIVDFVNGSRFTEANLDTATRQGTFIAAEGADAGQITSAIAQAAIAAQQADIAAQQADIATDAAGAAQASAGAIGAAVLSYATYAAAQVATEVLPSGQVVEVSQDETRAGARTRYRVQAGALVFVVNLEGFQQEGTGAVPTTVQSKLREIISANDFGAVGDGVTDETAKLQAAFDAAAGKVLLLGPNKTYGISSVSIPTNVTLIANGSKFKKLVASPVFALTGGIGLKADKLHLESVGGASDVGISLTGTGVQIQEIYIESLAADSGSSGSLVVGLLLGPASGTATGQAIHKVTIKNYCRPMVARNLRDGCINKVTFDNYRRGLYVLDCQDMVFMGGNAFGLSPSSTGGPGDNAVLIESSVDGGSQNLRFNSWVAKDSGEHGYRLGGAWPIRNVWFTDCSSIRAGAKVGATGGCGFKAQGSSSTSYHYNINLTNFICEDAAAEGGNFCGVLYALVDGGNIVNPIVRKRATTWSTHHGLSFLSCNNVTVSNPLVKDCRQIGLRLYSAASIGFPLGNNDVVVRGGTLEVRGVVGAESVISFEAIDSEFIRCGVDGVLVRYGSVALKAATPSAGGGYTGCFANFEYRDSLGAGGVLSGSTRSLLVNIVLAAVNTGFTAANGSMQRARSGKVYFLDADKWASVVGSFTTSIANGAAISWTPVNPSLHVFVTLASVAHYGQAWVRATAAPASVKVAGGANFTVLNAALTGTTGTDTNVTLGVQNGVLYLENRSGITQSVTITQLG